MRAVREAVRVRRNHGAALFPSLLPLLRQFWRIEGMDKAADGSLLRSGFVEINLRLQQVFNPKPTEQDALAAAAWDWANDSQGDLSISFDVFANSVMEMLWLYGTHTPSQLKNEVYHAQLLGDVLERISFIPQPEDEVYTVKAAFSKYDKENFRQALEQAFNEIDTDGSGTLDLEELKAMPGYKEGMLDKLDKAGDGVLSRSEFVDNLCRLEVDPQEVAAAQAEDDKGPEIPRRKYRDLYDIISLDGLRHAEAERPESTPSTDAPSYERLRRKSFVERMSDDVQLRHELARKLAEDELAARVARRPSLPSIDVRNEPDFPRAVSRNEPDFPTAVVKRTRMKPRRSSFDLGTRPTVVGDSLPPPAPFNSNGHRSSVYATMPGARPSSKVGGSDPRLLQQMNDAQAIIGAARSASRLGAKSVLPDIEPSTDDPPRAQSTVVRKPKRRSSLSAVGSVQWDGAVRLDTGAPRLASAVQIDCKQTEVGGPQWAGAL